MNSGRPPGFAVYVDGIMRGLLQQGSVRDIAFVNDTDVQVWLQHWQKGGRGVGGAFPFLTYSGHKCSLYAFCGAALCLQT